MNKMTPWTSKSIHNYSKSLCKRTSVKYFLWIFLFLRTMNVKSIQQTHTEYRFCSRRWIQQGNKKSMETYSCHKEVENPSQEIGNAYVWFLYHNPSVIVCICFNHLVPLIQVSPISQARVFESSGNFCFYFVSSTTLAHKTVNIWLINSSTHVSMNEK